MRKLTNSIWLISVLFCLNTIWAQTPVQELSAQLEKIRTMQAHFSQTLYSEQGKVLQKTSGQMYLQRPGKFHWQTNTPNQLLIANGSTLWIYDVELQQATQQRLDKRQSLSPAELLSGNINNLQQQFTVSAKSNANHNSLYSLKPKKANNMLQEVQLNFRNEQLQSLQFIDNLGQTSVFQFSQIQLNAPLNPQLFKFTAPNGVDIVRQ